jgi:hypothetical protein
LHQVDGWLRKSVTAGGGSAPLQEAQDPRPGLADDEPRLRPPSLSKELRRRALRNQEMARHSTASPVLSRPEDLAPGPQDSPRSVGRGGVSSPRLGPRSVSFKVGGTAAGKGSESKTAEQVMLEVTRALSDLAQVAASSQTTPLLPVSFCMSSHLVEHLPSCGSGRCGRAKRCDMG